MLVFMAKALRMISFGILAVVLIKHLFLVGFDGKSVGTILVLVVLGNMLISMILTKMARMIGNIYVLMIAAFLQCLLGLIYSNADDSMLTLLASLSGIISVTGR